MCLGPTGAGPGPHAQILELPKLVCNHQSRVRVGLVIPETYQAATHNSCVCNEYQALVNRHICERVTSFNNNIFKSRAKQFVKLIPIEAARVPYSEIVKRYTGGKRRMYEAARLLVLGPKFFKTWAKVKMFVKPDKYPRGSIDAKAPRAIQYRTPMYNLALATYLAPFEHSYYQYKDSYGLRVVAKSLNNLERADNIVQASKMFDNPCFVLCDHSKFDSHVNVDHLKFLHSIYNSHFKSEQLRKLLRLQLMNTGYSKGGIKYRVKGTRMSGDYDTALGNTLLNHYILDFVFRHVKHHILLDGDDSVIVLEKSDLDSINWHEFSILGMTTTYEVVFELTEVEFCRSRLVDVDRTPRFARDWKRALANMGISVQTYPDTKTWMRYYAGVGLGELAMSSGVPILGPLALKLSKLSERPILLPEYKFKGVYTHWVEVDDQARLDYYLQWGISPSEQENLERTILNTPVQNLLQNIDLYLSLQYE